MYVNNITEPTKNLAKRGPSILRNPQREEPPGDLSDTSKLQVGPTWIGSLANSATGSHERQASFSETREAQVAVTVVKLVSLVILVTVATIVIIVTLVTVKTLVKLVAVVTLVTVATVRILVTVYI